VEQFTLTLSAPAAGRTRFAYSMVKEVVQSVRTLADPASHALHLPWVTATRPAVAALDAGLLTALVPVPASYIPDFFTPGEVGLEPTLDAELDQLRAVPAARVRDGIDRLPAARRRDPAVRALYERPRAGLRRLAGQIEAYFEVAIAPHWPRMRRVLDGDVHYRAKRLAEGGLDRLFADLHPRVSWSGGTMRVAHRSLRQARTSQEEGLLLVPSVFAWPSIFSASAPWRQPMLTYPARGLAILWETGGGAPPDALAGVLGATRARLLAELGTPASTTDLAARTGLAAGSVSAHLTALRAAGLTAAHRDGRVVLYARTAVGDALLRSAAGAG
jgi:DNA-binding transcriptional ArsR family regulator